LAAVLVVLVAVGHAPARVIWWAAAVMALPVGQLVVVRPRLNRRSDPVLAGEDLPRSRGHLVCIAFESAKVLALIALGVTVLAQ
jgi:hypothetical protein